MPSQVEAKSTIRNKFSLGNLQWGCEPFTAVTSVDGPLHLTNKQTLTFWDTAHHLVNTFISRQCVPNWKLPLNNFNFTIRAINEIVMTYSRMQFKAGGKKGARISSSVLNFCPRTRRIRQHVVTSQIL